MGRLADLYGRKLVFLIGVAFIGASLWSSLRYRRRHGARPLDGDDD